jgi:aquaporin Z
MATKTAISSNKKSTNTKPQAKKTTTETNTDSIDAKTAYNSFCEKLRKMPLVGALIAEFIGTFLLVAAVFAVQGQPLYVAFALVGIVLLIGNVSGAHVNPAMTIGAWITRKIKGTYAIGYIIAQVLGAVVSWATLNAFLHSASAATSSTTAQTLYHAATITSGKEWSLFFAELLGTAILALGLAAAIRIKKANITAAFSYGLAILVALLVAGWVTSMSLTEANTALSFLNPAIAIAANGVSWNMWPIAIYIIAPIIGAVIGFAIQDFLKTQTIEGSCGCNCGCECCDIKK